MIGVSKLHLRYSQDTELVLHFGRRNYLLGNDPARWRTNIPTFRKVIYENIYPGIDLAYYGNSGKIEYDFEIAPRADPKAIRFAFDRDVRLSISESGDLVLRRKGVELIERRPRIYQIIAGGRREIEGQYSLKRNRHNLAAPSKARFRTRRSKVAGVQCTLLRGTRKPLPITWLAGQLNVFCHSITRSATGRTVGHM